MSGWSITFWFVDLFVGAGLIGYGLHIRERYSGGYLIVVLGMMMEILFIIFGPDMQ